MIVLETDQNSPITPLVNTPLSATHTPESSNSSLSDQLDIERASPFLNWQELDITHFVEKLSLMDLSLFQGVSYADIYHFMKDEKNCPEPILSIGSQFSRNINLIALQIVTAKTELQRRTLISKFLLIGRFLFEQHNFHGTMQIVMAFTNPAVNRLLSKSEISNNIWLTISSIADDKKNFHAYRSLLDKFQDTPTCLPIFSIILSDLTHDYEIFESAVQINNKSAMTSSLEGIAKALVTFSKFQTQPNPSFTPEDANDPLLRLFREFKEVDSEVIDVFSSIQKEWNLPCNLYKPRELKDWTPWYFAALLKATNCKGQIERIFEAGIYNGADLIRYMGDSNPRAKLAELGLNDKMINRIISAHF